MKAAHTFKNNIFQDIPLFIKFNVKITKYKLNIPKYNYKLNTYQHFSNILRTVSQH